MKPRALLVVLVLFAGVLLGAQPALACPACASAQRGGPSWFHLVLVLLPFVVVGLAARAILGALRDT